MKPNKNEMHDYGRYGGGAAEGIANPAQKAYPHEGLLSLSPSTCGGGWGEYNLQHKDSLRSQLRAHMYNKQNWGLCNGLAGLLLPHNALLMNDAADIDKLIGE